MAADIKRELGLESKLIAGSGGVFDVKVNDELVYSKKQEGNQFPEHSLVMQRISELNP